MITASRGDRFGFARMLPAILSAVFDARSMNRCALSESGLASTIGTPPPPVVANAAKLSADEVRMGEALVKQGMSPQDALTKILDLRDAMASSPAFAGLPSSAEARATLAHMKATKYKS